MPIGPSHADEADDRRALASDEFDRGVRWMEEGRCESRPVGDKDVCLKARGSFQRAFGIYPEGLGALRNLATVERALGLWASAARSYRELARRAPLDPKPARRGWAAIAVQELAQIENRPARVTIKVPDPAPEGTRVTLDGVAVPPAAWRVPLEVDPGDHTLVVTATGAKPYELAFSLSTSDIRSVAVDLLPDPKSDTQPAGGPPTTSAGEGLSAAKPAPSAAVAPPATKPEPGKNVYSNSRWAIATMAVGGVGAAVGFGFGVATLMQRGAGCDENLVCDAAALSNGRMLGDVATVAIAAGLVTAGAGLGWYLWDRRSTRDGASGASPPPPNVHRTARMAPIFGPGHVGLVLDARF